MVDILYAAALGVIAGVIPVYLGLIPVFFLRRISRTWTGFLSSFAAGILLFLFADVMQEALELSKTPTSSPFLLVLGLALGLLAPAIASVQKKWTSKESNSIGLADKNANKLFIAYMISVGIGLHNFGEGLALGSSYAAGELGLTVLLVVGFALHNGTEGFGIAAPLSDVKIGVRGPLLMGFVASIPTIFGSLVGSLSYSAAIGALFFAAAAGALLYVIVQFIKITYSLEKSLSHLISIMLGILLMYFTGLLVP